METKASRKVGRTLGWGISVFLICVLLIGFCGGIVPILGPAITSLFWNLGAGWVYFLIRVLPEITLNSTEVLTAFLCFGLLAYGVHRFGNWFYMQVQKKQQREMIQPWPWRWTFSLLTVIVLMFIAGIAAVGITHQTVWLVTTQKPFEPVKGDFDMSTFPRLPSSPQEK